MKFIKYIPIILLLLFSCNDIKNPVKDNPGNTCGDENLPTPIKKILVEDYTGHKCPNCPEAAEILQDVHNTYCDHIIPISIHVGFFASPDLDFPADYRTETGDELDDYFGVSNQGLPNGLIDRKEYDGNIVIGRDNWHSAVNLIYNSNPEATIVIESIYDQTEGKVTATVITEFLSVIDYELNLGLYLTEDSIISPQKDGTEVIESYVHRHVLRKGINGAFGQKLVSSAKFGDIIEKTFSFNVDPSWNINHCELVGFISNSGTHEIIQAESEHIIK